MLDYSLPAHWRPATFGALYSELALHRAALKTYTKSLFSWRKGLVVSHDGGTLYDFARRGPRHLEELHQALANQQFAFREGLELVRNFNGKERRVYLYPWTERLVDVLLYQLLNRWFHAVFSRDCYAYRYRGFGVDFCQDRVTHTLRRTPRPLYLLKRDIRDYFPSVDHELLQQAVAAWVKPGDYLHELLSQRIHFRFRRGEETVTATRGIPFGTPIACFFANLYLVPLDRGLRAVPGVHCWRYADDLLVLTPDRAAAVAADQCISETFTALRLESKPSHHLNLVVVAPEQAPVDPVFSPVHRFRYLGLEFRHDGSIGLSKDKFRKLCNLFRFAFRRRRRQLDREADPLARARIAIRIAANLIEHGLRPVAIIDYYLKHVTDEEQLRLLDRWLAEEILALAFRQGHRKGNFRLLPYRELRRLGLPSLCHRRRLLQHRHLDSSFFVLHNQRLLAAKRRRLPSRRDGISSVAGSTGRAAWSVRKDAGCSQT